ncbi:MAG: hypothetical protein A2Y40_03905 [Candidatus Margulisbacteria bacterium GWF2_35_9]|nr:MAG: hypothetical protein A2Y40_03905 [Candidatus Margulisbacteria bacterium GWF2_35_9]
MKIKISVAILVLVAVNLTFFGIKYIQIERNIEKYVDSSASENKSDTDNNELSLSQKPKELNPSNNLIEQSKNLPESMPIAIVTTPSIEIKGRIAIIIDDVGTKTFRYFLMDQIPYQLNLAVIPGFKDSKELVKQFADNKKYELLLHMPMEPRIKNGDQESHDLNTLKYQYMIRDGQDDKSIRKELTDALNSLDGLGIIRGLNNHMGSSVTSSQNMMESVMKWADKNKMYFVDSMTTAKSVAYEVAKKKKLKTAYNEVFLDGTDTPEYIRKSLEKLQNLAIKNGVAVAIGHIQRQHTLEVLFAEMPKMAAAGIKFVFVSEIL